MSAIEWTSVTYNPTVGCDKVSQGCKHCYAEVMAARLKAMGQKDYGDGFKLRVHEHRLDPGFSKHPFNIKEASLVFVNSMSDLFHKDVPLDFIQRVFAIASHPRGSHHTYQILTKRADRLAELASSLTWQANIWQGVSVESARHFDRIDRLRTVPAAVRFLSCEPLLGSLYGIDLTGIHWVIVGGESGPDARPMHPEWVEEIYLACQAAGVPFFFKQWGNWEPRRRDDGKPFDSMARHNRDRLISLDGCVHCFQESAGPGYANMSRVGKKLAGRLLHGRTYDEMPVRV